jgi:hypothetical protein
LTVWPQPTGLLTENLPVVSAKIYLQCPFANGHAMRYTLKL